MKKGKKKLVMALTIRGVLWVCTFALLISALVLIAWPTSPVQTQAGTDLIGAELDNLTIFHIGGGAPASQLVDRLEEMKGHVIRSSEIPEAVELNPEVVIIFGGEWFEGRAYDTELHDFLRLASSRGASMLMAGGTTSKFFEALDGAGIYEIPETETGIVRNPAYFNPPLVGLKMKTVDGHTGPSFLFSFEGSPDVLVEYLTEWLPSTTERVLEAPLAAPLGEPYLQFVTEYNYSPLLAKSPYGTLNVIVPIYKLKSDGVSNYDWYFYQVHVLSVPGTVDYPSSRPWRNDHTWAHHQVFDGGTNRWLVDYDPTTTSGTSTVGVSLAPGFTWSWSYSIADIAVLDNSDYSENLAYWQHDIDLEAAMGKQTYLSKPGFVVKTQQDSYSLVNAWYKVRFARHILWWSTYTLSHTPNLCLDAFRAGD